jgi:hypothetical protein
MANEVNPFEVQPPPKQPWGGMPQLVPQQEPSPLQAEAPQNYGGLQQGVGGSYFALSPEAMQMMWAPPPQPQIQAPPLPPPQQPLV